MAEFQEVMKQARRMCDECGVECAGCPLHFTSGCYFERVICEKNPASFELDTCIEIEHIVMKWAEEHPEPRYPSWVEWQKANFPASGNLICPAVYMPKSCCKGNCTACRKKPIPADIAEKLRIKPIGGVSDENA